MTCLGSEDRSGCCVQLALLVGRKLFVGQLGSGGAVLCEGREKGEDYKSHWLLRRLMKAAKG